MMSIRVCFSRLIALLHPSSFPSCQFAAERERSSLLPRTIALKAKTTLPSEETIVLHHASNGAQ
ncbi:hypothetical protein H6F89_28000 [Cyanobacteria bacterium FACHB-63]|nr:hypothetical protein [Cyanobacteria bacterium FACHB-63]